MRLSERVREFIFNRIRSFFNFLTAGRYETWSPETREQINVGIGISLIAFAFISSILTFCLVPTIVGAILPIFLLLIPSIMGMAFIGNGVNEQEIEAVPSVRIEKNQITSQNSLLSDILILNILSGLPHPPRILKWKV